MTDSDPTSDSLVRRSEDTTDETVDTADGLRKAILVDESHGAPNVAIRRFTLAPGGEVPEHTNDIEHEQYVLSGEYVVGIEDEEYTVSAGDALHIPAGAVPAGDDEIRLVE